MYKYFIRPLLFLFQPETVHHFLINFLKVLNHIPFTKALVRVFFMPEKKHVERKIFRLCFKNPVGLAAGNTA